MRAKLIMIALALLFSNATSVAAGENANAKILIRLLRGDRFVCSTHAIQPGTNCSTIQTTGCVPMRQFEYAFVLVADASAAAGIAGAQFGIDYDGAEGSGVDVWGWTLCATLEFSGSGWPNAGTGNLITWDSTKRCQRTEPAGPGTGVMAVAGYFYIGTYSADCLRITPRPVDHLAKVADCAAHEDIIGSDDPAIGARALGSACFSTDCNVAGYNPCGLATPVRASTWSSIKAMSK